MQTQNNNDTKKTLIYNNKIENINKSQKNKEIDKVLQINLKLAKIHHALFVESSHGPVKYAAKLLGLCSSETRLPLAVLIIKTLFFIILISSPLII